MCDATHEHVLPNVFLDLVVLFDRTARRYRKIHSPASPELIEGKFPEFAAPCRGLEVLAALWLVRYLRRAFCTNIYDALLRCLADLDWVTLSVTFPACLLLESVSVSLLVFLWKIVAVD